MSGQRSFWCNFFCSFRQAFNETIAASKANATESMKNIPLIMKLIKGANETAQLADTKVSSAEGDSEMSFNTATSASNVTQTAKNVRFACLFYWNTHHP